MTSQDGKQRLIDVATTEQVLRLIQSILSKKAEPFKLWLAQVGRERLEEIADPEKAIDRAIEKRTGKPVMTSDNARGMKELKKELKRELPEDLDK